MNISAGNIQGNGTLRANSAAIYIELSDPSSCGSDFIASEVTFTSRSGHSGASFTIAGPGTLPKLQAVPKADKECQETRTGLEAERVSSVEKYFSSRLSRLEDRVSSILLSGSPDTSSDVAQSLADMERRLEDLTAAVKQVNVSKVASPDGGHQDVQPVVCERGMGDRVTETYPRYVITTDQTIQRQILCETQTDGGGWTVIQRRAAGDVDFYRDWTAYRKGFGSLTVDFWLGNEAIYNLTDTVSNEAIYNLTETLSNEAIYNLTKTVSKKVIYNLTETVSTESIYNLKDTVSKEAIYHLTDTASKEAIYNLKDTVSKEAIYNLPDTVGNEAIYHLTDTISNEVFYNLIDTVSNEAIYNLTDTVSNEAIYNLTGTVGNEAIYHLTDTISNEAIYNLTDTVGNEAIYNLTDTVSNEAIYNLTDTVSNEAIYNLTDTVSNEAIYNLTDTVSNEAIYNLTDTVSNEAIYNLTDTVSNEVIYNLTDTVGNEAIYNLTDTVRNELIFKVADTVSNEAIYNHTDMVSNEAIYNLTDTVSKEAIYNLTDTYPYELRIDFRVNGQEMFAEYSTFRIEDESDKYRLRLGSYSGTIGEKSSHGLSYSNNQQFTTFDRDNDESSGANCAVDRHGAWWYKSCANSNLNGIWLEKAWKGVSWYNGSTWLYPEFTELKIRRVRQQIG
ncbi:hypothetical protein RRG08_042073 [Elysia crispata]|uniref:Fibrinogen C-terminal domain-containing protein n=1 Tax=Elysia crispata TaxID=231223 RepID=A0AAE0Z4I9_9GAST|nr:hypothetical protein RRG08_042073 [Elysia crispata]